MKMMKRITKPVFSSFLIGVGIFAQSALMFSVDAEIFKCTSKQGKVYYNDKSCPVESDEKKIQNEKDPVNGYIPPTFKHQGDHLNNKYKMTGGQTGKRFVKLDHPTSPDETRSQSGENSRMGGIRENSSEREKLPVIRFQDEDKKIDRKGGANNSHPAPITRNNKSRKLTLKEKKVMLGIRSVPE